MRSYYRIWWHLCLGMKLLIFVSIHWMEDLHSARLGLYQGIVVFNTICWQWALHWILCSRGWLYCPLDNYHMSLILFINYLKMILILLSLLIYLSHYGSSMAALFSDSHPNPTHSPMIKIYDISMDSQSNHMLPLSMTSRYVTIHSPITTILICRSSSHSFYFIQFYNI